MKVFFSEAKCCMQVRATNQTGYVFFDLQFNFERFVIRIVEQLYLTALVLDKMKHGGGKRYEQEG